jgi:hypothetical protein
LTIEQSIVAFLKADAGVNAACAGRVFDDEIPQQGPYPAVAFWRVSTPRGYVMEGRDGLALPRFQFDCCAAKKSEAKALSDAIGAAFAGFTYHQPLGGAGGVLTYAAFVQDERRATFYDGNSLIRCIELDIEIWHAE